MHFTTVSYAYPQVDGETRADLARRWRRDLTPADTFVLSTCLRFEVVVAGDEADLDRNLTRLLGNDASVAAGKVRSGEDAVHHLFRVAAGLESPIVGEREILTQFRQAVTGAEDAGRIGGLLIKLLEGAVAAGRQARELLPASPHDSLAAVAAQVVGGMDLVAVTGWGLMARSVVAGLQSLPAPPSIVVLARRPEQISADGVSVRNLRDLGTIIADVPALVSATSAKHHLVPDESLANALRARTEHLLLVDMAMPPDFPHVSGNAVEYIAIDDLARMADRRVRSADADDFVTAAAAATHRRLVDHHEVGPVIGELMSLADDIVEETVERFTGRLAEPTDAAVLRQAAHTVARTLLARPVDYMQRGDRDPSAIDVVAEAFDIDDG